MSELPLNLPLELMISFGSSHWEGHSPKPHCLQQGPDDESLPTLCDFFSTTVYNRIQTMSPFPPHMTSFPFLGWSCQRLHLLQMISVCYRLDLNCPPGPLCGRLVCFPESIRLRFWKLLEVGLLTGNGIVGDVTPLRVPKDPILWHCLLDTGPKVGSFALAHNVLR